MNRPKETINHVSRSKVCYKQQEVESIDKKKVCVCKRHYNTLKKV